MSASWEKSYSICGCNRYVHRVVSEWVVTGDFRIEDRELMDFQGTQSGELLTSDVWADAKSLQLFKNALKDIQTRV